MSGLRRRWIGITAALSLGILSCTAVTPATSEPIADYVIESARFCVDLTGKGAEPSSADIHLIELANDDAKRLGKTVEFYKVLNGGDGKSGIYVFMIPRYSDVYLVYRSDASRSKLVSRSNYASMHYPCDLPLPPRR